LLGGDSPFVKDRDNVLSSITFIVQKEHASVAAALEYQLNIVAKPRARAMSPLPSTAAARPPATQW